jgi:hypothetical protein
MQKSIVSVRTRADFQDYLVRLPVRRIAVYFDNHEIPWIGDQYDPKQGRSLVEQYYAGIDWKSESDIHKMFKVFEDILEDANEEVQAELDLGWLGSDTKIIDLWNRIMRGLQKDGFQYVNGRILPLGEAAVELDHQAQDLLDQHQFNEYVARIKTSIEKDPALAIGSTKELVEAVLKTILEKSGIQYDKNDDVPLLLKKAQKGLKLSPDDIDHAAKGADIIKILLSNLGQIVIKLAELRNFYGTGHGSGQKRKGMDVRHAKLAVNSGIALSVFFLDTFKSRQVK